MITSSKAIVTSSAVPIVTVSTSGNARITYTSTSYSSFQTMVPTLVANNAGGDPKPSNTGAIVGGVVGGVAAITLIGNYCLYI